MAYLSRNVEATSTQQGEANSACIHWNHAYNVQKHVVQSSAKKNVTFSMARTHVSKQAKNAIAHTPVRLRLQVLSKFK